MSLHLNNLNAITFSYHMSKKWVHFVECSFFVMTSNIDFNVRQILQLFVTVLCAVSQQLNRNVYSFIQRPWDLLANFRCSIIWYKRPDLPDLSHNWDWFFPLEKRPIRKENNVYWTTGLILFFFFSIININISPTSSVLMFTDVSRTQEQWIRKDSNIWFNGLSGVLEFYFTDMARDIDHCYRLFSLLAVISR